MDKLADGGSQSFGTVGAGNGTKSSQRGHKVNKEANQYHFIFYFLKEKSSESDVSDLFCSLKGTQRSLMLLVTPALFSHRIFSLVKAGRVYSQSRSPPQTAGADTRAAGGK